MRRVYIVLALIALIVLCSATSFYRIDGMKNQMLTRIDRSIELIGDQKQEVLEHQVDELYIYWKTEEHTMIHFVRHMMIDEISKSVARLPALARHTDFGELEAELFNIRWQVEHIWESERPTLKNLF